jgi:hypothetical protein
MIEKGKTEWVETSNAQNLQLDFRPLKLGKKVSGVGLKRPSTEKYIKTELVLKEDFYFVFGSFSF